MFLFLFFPKYLFAGGDIRVLSLVAPQVIR
jgi:hypothetical protein